MLHRLFYSTQRIHQLKKRILFCYMYFVIIHRNCGKIFKVENVFWRMNITSEHLHISNFKLFQAYLFCSEIILLVATHTYFYATTRLENDLASISNERPLDLNISNKVNMQRTPNFFEWFFNRIWMKFKQTSFVFVQAAVVAGIRAAVAGIREVVAGTRAEMAIIMVR